jgi:hypothetical protein
MTDQCNVCLSVSFTTDMRPQKRQVMQQKMHLENITHVHDKEAHISSRVVAKCLSRTMLTL